MDDQARDQTLADFGGVLRYPLLVSMLIHTLMGWFGILPVPVTPRPIHASGRESWEPDDTPDQLPPNRMTQSAT
jgi:hypothetical protein